MRKLACIRRISALQPINGADRIEVAIVNGWKVVVNKGIHSVGELVVYCEIDSLLPIRDEFEFLRKSSYKKMSDGTEGFRLRTVTLRGQISQGLVIPMSVLPNGNYNEGDEVTEVLGIVKYEPPIPAELTGKVRGYFPSFIQKTDEERIQNLAEDYTNLRKLRYFASEKLDGTSTTMYLNENIFGVCSRNLDLEESQCTQWRIAREQDVENKLRMFGRNLAIQGEIIGEGIQGNPYKLRGQQFRVFNIFDIDTYQYLTKIEMLEITENFNLLTVPTIFDEIELPETIDEILKMAEGKSMLNQNAEREGLVWVSVNSPDRISFKTISNKFLLGNDE